MNLNRYLSCFLLTAIILLFACFSSAAQEIYRPRKTYAEKNRNFVKEIRLDSEEAFSTIKSPRKEMVRQVYFQRFQYLISCITQGLFIDDDTLQSMVEGVMQRIVENNNLIHLPKRILIQKNPVANAFCYGEGTFVVTIGLLGSISNESQLGFALAHELAHYELDHIKNRIVQHVERSFAKKTKQEMQKLLSGNNTLDNVATFRGLIYGESRFNREKEFQADSLGFVFFRNAKYNEAEALALLSLLDSSRMEEYPLGKQLFLPLHSGKYAFQEHWIRPRLRIYNKKYDNTFIFKNDSISSHPDIDLRRQNLDAIIDGSDQPLNYQSEDFIQATINRAEFESIESAYFLKQYDRCLHLGLRLMARYPNNSYIIAMVSRVLIELYDLKGNEMNEMFSLYVPRFTSYYSADLRLVNNFLHNIIKEEMGEIAYNFLNSQSHFDESNEEHYFLLWKLCDLTERKEVKKRIMQSYTAKFGNGKFSSFMK